MKALTITSSGGSGGGKILSSLVAKPKEKEVVVADDDDEEVMEEEVAVEIIEARRSLKAFRDRMETHTIEEMNLKRRKTEGVIDGVMEPVLPLMGPEDINAHFRHPNDEFIRRHPDENLHVYLHKDRNTGVESVVPISGSEFKKQFFAEFDGDFIIKCMFSRQGHSETYLKTDSPYFGMTREGIKQAWIEHRDAGTDFHKLIELYVNEYRGALPLKDVFVQAVLKNAGFNTAATHAAKVGHVYSFFRYLADNAWKPYRTEWVIYDDANNIAGTVDAVFYREVAGSEREFMLVDWKTLRNDDIDSSSKKCLYPMGNMPDCKHTEYVIQLFYYAHILNTHYAGVHISNVVVVCVSARRCKFIKLDPPSPSCTALLSFYKNNLDEAARMRAWYDGEPGSMPGFLYSARPVMSLGAEGEEGD